MSNSSSGLGFVGSAARFDSFHNQGQNGTTRYPSPFFDIGHTYLPTSVKQMFRWCRYYFLVNPLINAVTYKMAEYPITKIQVQEADSVLRDKWTKLIDTGLKLRNTLIEVGLDYFCFHGDTKVTTREGVFKLRELVGKTVDVLSAGGIYRPAEFKAFGKQKLLEVEFNDGRTVLATPEHQWVVVTSNGKEIRVPTTELTGRRILRNVAPRPERNSDFYEGVRHGFVFGDGTLYNDGKQSRAYFYGEKDLEMLKYFEGHGSAPTKAEDGTVMVHGLSPYYKQLPGNTNSANYWYGFLSGFLAADGSVDVNGCAVLTQKAKATLEAIADQLPRIGMIAGQVRGYERSTSFEYKDKVYNYDGEMYFLSLFKQYLLPQDFLLSRHRTNFENNFKPTKYGSYVHVKDVRETGLVDEVFCAVEMETHTFTIDNGVLTGNCYGNAFVTIHWPIIKSLICSNCECKVVAKNAIYKFRNFRYFLSCSACKVTAEAAVEDLNIKDLRGIKVVRWNPEHITVEHNEVTNRTDYFFDIPISLKNDIMMGKRHVIESIPNEFILALRESKTLKMREGEMFHLRRPTIAQKDMGWGMPLILPVLKDSYYLQVLRKAQESIAQQYIVPLRVLFPQAGSGTSDPYSTIDLSLWRRRIEAEIEKWKLDQNYIPILPIPIGNETIGGEGKALMLHQEMRAWSEQIVAGMHVPIEFVFGGLQYSGSNVSMRMLENQFDSYRTDLLVMCRDFILKRVANYMDWPAPDIEFSRFRMADDLQRSALMMQANQAMKVSDTSFLNELELDLVQEEKYKAAELSKQLENNRRMQIANAQLQGELQIIQARYQAQAMKIMGTVAPGAMPTAPSSPGGFGSSAGGATMDNDAAPAPGMPTGGDAGGGQGESDQTMPGGGPPASGTNQQPMQGEQAAPGMPASATVYPENAQQAPAEGLPTEVQSPLNMTQAGGGLNILHLARRAATAMGKMEGMGKQLALMDMRVSNPNLYKITLSILQGEQGSQEDNLNPLQKPLPENKPPRRQVSLG